MTITFIKHHEICMHPPLSIPLVPFFLLLPLPLLFHEILALGQYHLEITTAAEFHLDK